MSGLCRSSAIAWGFVLVGVISTASFLGPGARVRAWRAGLLLLLAITVGGGLSMRLAAVHPDWARSNDTDGPSAAWVSGMAAEDALLLLLPIWLIVCTLGHLTGRINLRWALLAAGAGCAVCVVGVSAGVAPWGVMDGEGDCRAAISSYIGQTLVGSVPLSLSALILSKVPWRSGSTDERPG